MRGRSKQQESHFWLINTGASGAIVINTEIGLKRWLYFQATAKAQHNDTTTGKGSTHVQENSNKSCRGVFPWANR
ncbi:MAG: hypothetical protein ACTHV7_10635, partial [Oleiphilaceae bacterium]